MGINLYTTRLILKALGENDYGLYGVVGSVVTLLTFLNGNLAGTIQRFINFEIGERNDEKLRKVVASGKKIQLWLAIGILLVCETIGLWYLNFYMQVPNEQYFAANIVFQLSILAAILNILWVPYVGLIVAYERMTIFAYAAILGSVLQLIGALLLTGLPGNHLIEWAVYIVLVNICLRFIYLRYCKKNFEVASISINEADKKLSKSMLSFTSWSFIGNLAYMSHGTGMQLVLNFFFGAVVNAAAQLASTINGYLTTFLTNFLLAMNPQITKTYADRDYDSMYRLIIQGSRYGIFLTAIFVVPFFVGAPIVLELWLKNVPEWTVLFSRFIAIIALINSISSILVTAQNATGKIKRYQIAMTTIAITQVPLAIVAFNLGASPWWGYAINTFLVLAMQATRLYFMRRDVGLSIMTYMKKVIIPCTILVVLSLILSETAYIVIASESIFANLSAIMLSICITTGAIYLLGLNRAEKIKVNHLIYSKIRGIAVR